MLSSTASSDVPQAHYKVCGTQSAQFDYLVVPPEACLAPACGRIIIIIIIVIIIIMIIILMTMIIIILHHQNPPSIITEAAT